MLKEVFKMKIFWLAMIIMAEIHKVSKIRGADKESENSSKFEKEGPSIEE